MGFFSWKTSDTKRTIPNRYSELPTFPVVMIDDKGNQYVEEDYQGYGVFGGKDFYELVAQMNNGKLSGVTDKDRMLGIELLFNNNPGGSGKVALKNGVKQPLLVEKSELNNLLENRTIEELFHYLSPPEPCDYQGYFYDFDEEEEW